MRSFRTPIRAGLASLHRAVRIAWRGVREWCGDSAYERYLHSKNSQSDSCPTLSPSEFYVEQLGRRYSRPGRCC
jgi:uncharacterized short protein YbdD (DUF466 family)